jgi:hypothetical protein
MTMQTKVLSFSRGSKPAVLASVRIELAVEGTCYSVLPALEAWEREQQAALP